MTMTNTTNTATEIEILTDTPNGPQVEYSADDDDTSDVDAVAAAAGWRVDWETPAYKLASGRFRAPLMRVTANTATDAQLWNLSRHAVNDTTRAIARAGIVLTHDQADDLGEEAIDWARRELDLHVTTTDEHVILCPWAVGDRVEGGEPGTEDHDTGRVIEVDGTRVHVAWDTLVTAWHGADELRPWADRS